MHSTQTSKSTEASAESHGHYIHARGSHFRMGMHMYQSSAAQRYATYECRCAVLVNFAGLYKQKKQGSCATQSLCAYSQLSMLQSHTAAGHAGYVQIKAGMQGWYGNQQVAGA